MATINLTGDDSENVPQGPEVPSSGHSNPALGGGEAVRLCKPCVPDPQPAPSVPSTSPHRSSTRWMNGIAVDESYDTIRRMNWQNEWQTDSLLRTDPTSHTDRHDRVHPPNLPGPGWGLPSEPFRDFRRQRGRGIIDGDNNLNAARTSAGDIPEEGPPRYSGIDYTVVPTYARRGLPPGYTPQQLPDASLEYRSRSGSAPTHSGMWRNSLPDPRVLSNALPSLRRPPSGPFSRNRAPSELPPRPHPTPPSNRPRVRSMLEPFTSVPGSSAQPRPRLTERDVCPICRRVFPPLGPNNSETDRERHIVDCITSREAAASSIAPRERALSGNSNRGGPAGDAHRRGESVSSPPPTPAPQMLPFKATEKDCISQEGGTKECSICMVEYDVGDALARLECLCCFHESCIRSWFERKKECPVHKVA
ncbi:MAG: hypothetical protein Q9227_000341 [Pyrenula ochraceoflavens]